MSEDNWKVIDALCFFRSGIHPSFEDTHNDSGIGLYYVFEGLKEEQLDSLWNNIAAAIAGEDLCLSDKITGVRIVDKCNDYKFLFRVEFWMGEDVSASPEFDLLKNQINTLICDSNINHFQKPIMKPHKVDKKQDKSAQKPKEKIEMNK